MARILSKGEKPLNWVGSSKKEFLFFPGPVKDEVGMLWGWLSLAANTPRQNPGKDWGRASSK